MVANKAFFSENVLGERGGSRQVQQPGRQTPERGENVTISRIDHSMLHDYILYVNLR